MNNITHPYLCSVYAHILGWGHHLNSQSLTQQIYTKLMKLSFLSLSLFFFLGLLIFERERQWDCTCSGESREKTKQAPHCQSRAQPGAWTLKPWDHDLSWNQESDPQQTEPPRCPEADEVFTSWSLFAQVISKALWWFYTHSFAFS